MNAKTIQKKERLAAFAAIMALMFTGFLNTVTAAEEKKDAPKVTMTAKEIKGEVTWVGKDKIAVVYKRELDIGKEYEILLSFDEKQVKVEHQKKMKDLLKGDTVTIQYEETNEETPEGIKTSSQAKVVSFIKRAPAQDSLLSLEDPLVLKGTK